MKTRAFLTILISLMTGFAIGFVVAGQIGKWRTKDIQSMSSEESFRQRTFSIIEPTPEQQEKIIPVIDEYARKADSLKAAYRKGFNKFFEEYHSQLEPYLEPEQVQKLREFPKHRSGKPGENPAAKKPAEHAAGDSVK
jgi:hypothetical protein